MILPTQLHISRAEALVERIHPVRNDGWIKPVGGLWTSSYVDESSQWVRWCRDNGFDSPAIKTWFALDVAPDARVRVISSLSDLASVIREYPTRNPWRKALIDFEALSRDFDALHLTEGAELATRWGEPNLYGWDVESTVWFRWKFTAVRKVRVATLVEAGVAL